MKNLTVVKSNRIIEASYKLTLMEQLILLSCIAQIDSRAVLTTAMRFEIGVSDLLNIKSSETKNEYRDLKIASERLLSRIVTINNPYPNEPKVKQLKTHWVSYVAYMPDVGKIRLGFSPEITPYLSELSKEFTRYDLKHVGNMTSIYAIRLYELLMQWKGLGSREIEIDWLKKQFQIEDKYASIKDLKKYVIDPAVKDINTHSNFQVSWTQRKTGRKVTHLIFEFSEKTEKKTPKTKAKDKDKNTADIFHGLTDKQIDLFSSKLANDSEFGSRYAKIGEEMPAFIIRIKQELKDPEKQKLYLPFLKQYGFK